MPLSFAASAPSNIALIKYMGKTSTATNVPTNASLSYTLDHLRSFITLETADEDDWETLPGFSALNLSQTGRQKFMAHLSRLREVWGVNQKFVVRSANNFPSDCGLASSASSFAALTEAVYAYSRHASKQEVAVAERSRLSRLGSGSSCRSFFSPWAEWRGEGAEPVPALSLRLAHAVIVVSETTKAISSSRAHALVTGSPRFAGRPERAEARLTELRAVLARGGPALAPRPPAEASAATDWRRAYEICRDEFEDMHALFETCAAPFTYRTEDTRRVVDLLAREWDLNNDGPLVTMDAGPNVHLLLRPDQTARADEYLAAHRALKSWSPP